MTAHEAVLAVSVAGAALLARGALLKVFLESDVTLDVALDQPARRCTDTNIIDRAMISFRRRLSWTTLHSATQRVKLQVSPELVSR